MLLIKGKGNGTDTACVVSLASLKAGQAFTDYPTCVCPTIRSLAVPLNDEAWWASDEERTEALTPLASRLVGTNDPSKLEARARLAFLGAVGAVSVVFGLQGLRLRVRRGDSYEKIMQRLVPVNEALDEIRHVGGWSRAHAQAQGARRAVDNLIVAAALDADSDAWHAACAHARARYAVYFAAVAVGGATSAAISRANDAGRVIREAASSLAYAPGDVAYTTRRKIRNGLHKLILKMIEV